MKRTTALLLVFLTPVILAPTCVTSGDLDYDDDGDTYTEEDGDCDDTDNTIYPGRVWLNGSYHGTSVAAAIADTTSGAWDEVLACGQFDEGVDFGTRTKVKLEGYYVSDGEGGIIPATTLKRANLVSVELIVIDGVSFVDGEAPSSLSYRGGCLNINGSSGVVINHSIMTGCYASSHGGAAYINNANAAFNDVQIIETDSGDHGGGIYVRGTSVLTYSGGQMTDVVNNAAYVRDTDADPIINFDDVDFSGNVACDAKFDSGACVTLGAAYSGTCTEGACD